MTNRRPLIIVDIDNTILNNDVRKQTILNGELGRNVGLGEVRKDYNLTRTLAEGKTRRAFWAKFFSGNYLFLDKPLKSAASVLSDLAREFDIAYVTGRHHDPSRDDSMKEATLESLKRHGFPVERPGIGIYFKDKRATPDSRFKTKIIRSLIARRQIAFGIGDTPEDFRIYSGLGLQPIMIRTPYFDDEQLSVDQPAPPMIVNSWLEVKNAIRLMRHNPRSKSRRAS